MTSKSEISKSEDISERVKYGPWLDQYPLKREASNIWEGFKIGFWIPFTPSDEQLMSDYQTLIEQYEAVVADKMQK